MEQQTRVISKVFEDTIAEAAADPDILLKMQIEATREKMTSWDDLEQVAAHATMEMVVRQCAVMKALDRRYPIFLELLINDLAEIFVEAGNGGTGR